MNFIAICLHCLDMRDFHSDLRDTPFLDILRQNSIFIPMGRGQGHHQFDSLNAELTGIWTARQSNSVLTKSGFSAPDKYQLPKTLIEYMGEQGYDLFTCIGFDPDQKMGSYAVPGGMKALWLREEPERLRQFNFPERMSRSEWLDKLINSKRFYAHIVLRETHRPWAQEKGLYSMMGLRWKAWRWYRLKRGLPCYYPYDAFLARRASLEKPDEFAALRRKGLTMADRIVKEIFEKTKALDNVSYIIYSNHGEVFDHFRYNQPYTNTINNGLRMIEGTSHGNTPYEVLYANMQIWIIPNYTSRVMRGLGRSIDYTPTVLDLAGITPASMDGESMLGHFSEGVFPARDRYAETPMQGGCVSMFRKNGFKFIAIGNDAKAKDHFCTSRCFENHRMAVFDLNIDPYEYVNLIETKQGQEVFEWAISRHRELKPER
jgi:hypothetical protein